MIATFDLLHFRVLLVPMKQNFVVIRFFSILTMAIFYGLLRVFFKHFDFWRILCRPFQLIKNHRLLLYDLLSYV